MPFTVTMPKLSPTMEEGSIVKWHAKEGDLVKEGQLLIEVATDKATVEYNALDEGYLRKILVKEGSMAKVNQPIGIFTVKKDESIEGYKTVEETLDVKTPAKAEKKAKKEEEAPAPVAAGAMAQPAFVPEPPLENYKFPKPSDYQERTMASPLARKLAKEKGLDLSTVPGSGPSGRVMSKDLDLAQPAALTTFGKREVPTIPPGTYEEIPLSPMRKIIGKRLQESKTFIPHFYVSQDVNVSLLVTLREQLKEFELKPTLNDFIIRACALALKEHPLVNTGFDSVKQAIISFKTIDISVAVSIEGGLITPIIRHADYKNVGQISVEIKELVKRAKEGKLDPTEYKGGSFSVSNLGMFGISDFVAVINPPQAAILAVGGIEEKPIFINNEIKPAKIMRLTLSVDHRVIDGAEAAKFIKTVQKILENPAILLVS
ncbi:MAG TPA: pyruvate dehydrogenase complex dihydrolipoamide acetyltransferase [Chlamydiales bacterium]|nr:pyruvate dehydrogenase complex dihydrolipoamide acetyltransferase [Chlamydiales bacterium]